MFCARVLTIASLLFLVSSKISVKTAVKTIRIGAIFEHDSKEALSAFRYAVDQYNLGDKTTQFRLKPVIDQLDVSDSFNLTNTLCRRMESGVFAFFGLKNMTSLNVVQSLSRRSSMPFVSPNLSPVTSSSTSQYEVHMMPPYTDAIIDLIVYYQWEKIHYLYDSDEGLRRLDAMYSTSKLFTYLRSIVSWRVRDPYRMHDDLRRLDFSEKTMPRCYEQKSRRNIVVDLSSISCYRHFIKQISDVGMNKCGYHYLFTSPGFLELNVDSLQHGGVNLTGLQLLDPSSGVLRKFINKWKYLSPRRWPGAGVAQISYLVALMVDSVTVFTRALDRLQHNDGFKFRRGHVYNNESRGVPCRKKPVQWIHGPNIVEEMKKVLPTIDVLTLEYSDVKIDGKIYAKNTMKFDGLSGKVAFDKRGIRTAYQLQIYEFGLNYGPAPLMRWSPTRRVTSHKTYPVDYRDGDGHTKNRTIEIVGVVTPPYMMKKKKDHNGAPLTGNNLYEGFCVDLAKQIMLRGSFHDYILRPSKDGKHGVDINGTWNGIIGELLNKTCDLGIADLTITTDREKVVDFSKPFMDVGISIMIKKPEAQKPGVFSFMTPLSNEIWMCIIAAYVVVSASLFFVTRLSPYVRKNSSNEDDSDEEFGITCCMWFALGALMQQGGDVFPRTSAGRVIGSVWWFFTLIVISSYTANLAAFLTIESMVTPVNSAKELADQTEISYGTLNGGSTKTFFKNSNQSVYKKMWEYMKSRPSVFVDSTKEGIDRTISSNKYAFLLESTTNDYTNNRCPCKTMKVGPNLDSKNYGIATQSGSDLREGVSMSVLKMMEDGTLRQMKKRWWYDKGECSAPDGGSSKDKAKALSLKNMAGIFYILIGGLTLSMVVGMIELHIKAKQLRKRQNIGLLSRSRDSSTSSFKKAQSRQHSGYHPDHSDTEPPGLPDYVNLGIHYPSTNSDGVSSENVPFNGLVSMVTAAPYHVPLYPGRSVLQL